MTLSVAEVWVVIVALAVGTFLIRFSFLGLLGDRPLPPFVLKLLRFTPVAILPALVAPMVIWPSATEGTFDPARLAAALVALAVGAYTKSLLGAIFAGMGTLYASFYVFG